MSRELFAVQDLPENITVKSISSRLDPELKGMLNRLLTGLTEYESQLKPIITEVGKIKRANKPTFKNLPTQEVKTAIQGILEQKGLDSAQDISSGNFKNLERAISSLIATDPGLWPDLIEKALGQTPSAGAKTISRVQTGLVESEPFNVGHHEQGLKSLRPVLEYLQTLKGGVRERTLHVLEKQYGIDFGELGLRFLFPFAHRPQDFGREGAKGPAQMRGDIKDIFNKAFPEIGGIENIDQVNPKLRSLFEPFLAHSKAQHGTKGFVTPVDLIKGETNPNVIAKKLLPFLDAQKVGAENALQLNKVINQLGLKDGVINREAWLPGGSIETAVEKLPLIKLGDEKVWSKRSPTVTPATVKEIDKYTGNVPWAQRVSDVYSKIPRPLKIGAGMTALGAAFDTYDVIAGEAKAKEATEDTLASKYRKAEGNLQSLSGKTGLTGTGVGLIGGAKTPSPLLTTAGLTSLFTGLASMRAGQLADKEERRIRDQKIKTGEIQMSGNYSHSEDNPVEIKPYTRVDRLLEASAQWNLK